MKSFLFGSVLLWAVTMTCHATDDVFLASGKTVRVIDVERPLQRFVITAPGPEPLDISEVLTVTSSSEVPSIVTRVQAPRAEALSRDADGTVSLTTMERSYEGAKLLQGGVLMFQGGTWSIHPDE